MFDQDQRNAEIQQIVDGLRADNPNLRIFEIVVPGHEEEIFLARKASWNEYKRLLGVSDTMAGANELLIQKFLVHPKPENELIQMQWDPGLVLTLAAQIQAGMGFTKGASIKNW